MTTREEMQERVERAMERYKKKQVRRKCKAVKLFSVERYEPQGERADMELDKTRKGELY
jgi:hypothetical protein